MSNPKAASTVRVDAISPPGVSRPSRDTSDAGVVFVTLGMLIVPLMIFAAIGVDIAAWYARAAHLQKSADAAALAATVWMPATETARQAASATLKDNEIDAACGTNSGPIHVTCTFPAGTRVTVTVTDTKAPVFFGSVIGHQQSIRRTATAQYNAPLSMGSPTASIGGVPSRYGGPAAPKFLDDANFWANIFGPDSAAASGDIFSSRCYAGDRCDTGAAPTNRQYRGDTENAGYIYALTATGTAPINLEVFDAGFYHRGWEFSETGDNIYTGGFTTEFTALAPDATVHDHTDNPPMGPSRCGYTGAGNPQTSPNSGHWQLTTNDGTDATFKNKWVNLCTWTPDAVGDVLLLRVRTLHSPNFTWGAGANRYALQAVNADGTAAAATLSALSDISIFANLVGQSATFHLARVPASYIGNALAVELWDPGDTSGDSSITITGPNGHVACRYRSSYATGYSPASPPSHGNGVGGMPGPIRQSDSTPPNPCTIATSVPGSKFLNAQWVHVTIPLTNANNSCDEDDFNDCWWKVTYTFNGHTADTTTWAAHIEGLPVRLVE